MHTIDNMIFCPNGQVIAFDATGQQIPDLQLPSWIELYFDFLESKGYDPTKIWMEGLLNKNQWKRIIALKREDGSWIIDFGSPRPAL